MKHVLSVTVFCLQWKPAQVLQYLVYSQVHMWYILAKCLSVWAPKTIFTLCSAPEISLSFKPLSNNYYLDVSEVF